MQNSAEALKILGLTLEKYEINKTKVPESDLKGKYRTAFCNLQQQLKTDLENYANLRIVEALPDGKIKPSAGDELTRIIVADYKRRGIEKKIGLAAFRHFDLQEIISIMDEEHERMKSIWTEFLLKHPGDFIAPAKGKEISL